MTSVSGISTTVTPVTDTQASASAASQAAAANAKAVSSTAASSAAASTQSSAATISPRLVYNAAAGVIVTEFLSSAGQIQVQLPSKVAVAYLQAGLTQQGLPVKSAFSDSGDSSAASA